MATNWLEEVVVPFIVIPELSAMSEPPTEREPEKMPLPFTEKVFEGEVVPMPILSFKVSKERKGVAVLEVAKEKAFKLPDLIVEVEKFE